jgi:signal transduction histidine kinase
LVRSCGERGRDRRLDSLGGDADPDEQAGVIVLSLVDLSGFAGAWPFGASLAAAASGRALLAGRRRSALNEALHELRRPLQALALSASATGPGAETAGLDGSVQMAVAALERLQCEINGEAVVAARARFPARPLLESAAARWRGRAALAGAAIAVEWRGGEALLSGDRGQVAEALDNLIVNAIEHGGSRISVVAAVESRSLIVSVLDSGRGSRPEPGGERPGELIARLTGRRRHGHGLRVVRRIAAAHGGEFSLRCGEAGTEAVLELPLAGAARPA